MHIKVMWLPSTAVLTPSKGSTAASVVRLAALSALLAAAVLQLRRLRRLKADLQRAEVRKCFCAMQFCRRRQCWRAVLLQVPA